MLQIIEQNNKFKSAIIISVILHVLLFEAIIWNPFKKHIEIASSSRGGSSIDAVIVDLNTITKNYNYQQQEQRTIEPNEDRSKKQVTNVVKEYVKQNKKQTENILKKAQEQKKQAKETPVNTGLGTQKKEQIKAGETTNKVNLEKRTNADKTLLRRKVMSEKTASISDVEDLFSNLRSSKNVPNTDNKINENTTLPIGSHNIKNNDPSNDDIIKYAEQIKTTIESHFYNASSYSGKTCTLRIKLAPDGILLNIKSEGGDPALCNAAIAAANQEKMPKPPSRAVYEIFKNVLLDFKP